MTSLLPFLTAWDPTDLPGYSVDPLGFDRCYTQLAELWLPGLTNVARQPRYFSLLCAGLALSPQAGAAPTRAEIEQRKTAVQRLERFWVLGHAVLEQQRGTSASGVRGVTYAMSHLEELLDRRATSTTSKFRLLLSQTRYGVLGIYGRAAESLGLTSGATLGLTSDLGETLATAFLDGSATPESIQRAVIAEDESSKVPLADLAAWVERAHVGTKLQAKERSTLVQALRSNPTRARVADAMQRTVWRRDEETELAYLSRLEHAFPDADDDLRSIATAIRLLEDVYGRCSLLMERLAWMCDQPTELTLEKAADDTVLSPTAKSLPQAIRMLTSHVDADATGAFDSGDWKADDLWGHFEKLVAVEGDPKRTIECALQRHKDVQGAKRANGKPKLPWVELDEDRLRLTQSRARQRLEPPTTSEDMGAHEYRTRTPHEFLFDTSTIP
jgi:hypothetical protein